MVDALSNLAKVGDYVDCKESSQRWSVARIVSHDESSGTFKVKPDGASEKLSMTLPASSERLAPFRKHSRLYTGQSKLAIRDWVFSEEEISGINSKVAGLNGLGTGSAYDTTQLLRGILYTTVDNLLVHNYSSSSDRLLAVRFIMTVLDYIEKWLSSSENLFPLLKQPQQYLSDDQTAVAMAWPELLHTLRRLFGQDFRTSKFFEVTEVLPLENLSNIITKKKEGTNILAFHINYFASIGGFTSILQLMKHSPPFEFLAELPVYFIGGLFAPDFFVQWVGAFKDLLIQRVQTIDSSEIKDIDKDCVLKVLNTAKDLFRELDNENFADTIQKVELDLLLKYLKCPYLEKKLRSLNEIREILEHFSVLRSYSPVRWLTPAVMVQWLNDNSVIDVIFEHSHSELIKRSSDILLFMARQRALSDEVLDKVWSFTRNRHESLITSVYHVIIDIVFKLPPSSHSFLLSKFAEVDTYDEQFTTFLKDFVCKLSNSTGENPVTDYGLKVFFKLMNEDTSQQKQIARHIDEILRKPAGRGKLWEYFDLCVDNIKDNTAMPQSLALIRGIIDILHNQQKLLYNRDARLQRFHSELVGLIDLVLLNTQKYVLDGLSAISCNGEHLTERLGFLEDMHKNHSLLISIDQFGLLWGLFVLRPDSDSSLFFRWTVGIFRDLSTIRFSQVVYKRFFCSSDCLDPSKISEDAFACFLQFFTVINAEERSIQIKNNLFYVRIAEQLNGLSTLFRIYLNCENEDVRAESAVLIVNLMLRLSPQLPEQKIWTQFITSCFQTIEENRSNPRVVARSLHLLHKFMENNPPKEDGFTGSNVEWSFKTSSELMFNKVVLRSDQTVSSLRKRVATHYQKKIDSVVLMIGNSKVDRYDDHTPLNVYRDSIAHVEFSGRAIEGNPKDTLISFPNIQKNLFGLLSEDSNEVSEVAWKILASLPLCKEMTAQFKALNKPVEELIEVASTYRLTYSLLIVEQLAQSKGWVLKFYQLRGLQHLWHILLEVPCQTPTLFPAFLARILGVLNKILIIVRQPIPEFSIERVLVSLIDVAGVLGEHDPEVAIEVCSNAGSLMFTAFQNASTQFTRRLVKFAEIERLLRPCFFECANHTFSGKVGDFLFNLSDIISEFGENLLEKMLDFINSAIKYTDKGEKYWTLLESLISKSGKYIEVSRVHLLVKELVSRKPEDSFKDKDCCLVGMLSMLNVSIPKSDCQVSESLILYILQDGLFGSKFKTRPTRKCAFELLKTLSRKSLRTKPILLYLRNFHQELHWRTPRYEDWYYSPSPSERSESGYVGLKNQGCTCYMNSSLQQLFHIPSFRDGILQASDASGLPLEDNLLVQLQKLFSGLKISDREFIDTRDFCTTIKDYTGKPVNVMEQMDADEFFNNLMDNLEKQLQNQKYIIKDHFEGVQVTECIGKGDCTHISERLEPFISISLQVKNKANIYESLDTYVQGDLLENENAYQCDHCNTKVTALRRVCFKHLPNILVIALKRFEFDFDSMKRLKLNDYYEFPHEIDMRGYVQESQETEKPEDYFKYELRGIVIHVGTADFGHYYSIIKDNNFWFTFNDTLVSPFDPSNIPEEAFGGGEKLNRHYVPRERTKSAYMLFYERSTKFETISIESKDFSHIIETNERDWLRRSVFSHEYFDFMHFLTNFEDEDTLKFIIEFFLTIMIRSREYTKFPHFMKWILSQMKKFPKVSEWLLEMITVPDVLQELLLDCPMMEKRKIMLSILKSAIFMINRNSRESVLCRLLNKLEAAKKPYSYNFSQFYELMFAVVEPFPELIVKTNLTHKLLGHILENNCSYHLYSVPEKYDDISLGYSTVSENTAKDRYLLKEANYSYLIACLNSGAKNLDFFDVSRIMSEESMLVFNKSHLNKYGCRALAELYANICDKNKDFSFKYINFLMECIGREDYDKHTQYFRQLIWFLKHQDNLQGERTDYALKIFLEMLKINQTFYRATESCIQFLIKISMRLPYAKEWVIRNKKEVKWADTWLKDVYTYASNAMFYQKLSVFKNNANEGLPYSVLDASDYLLYQFKKIFYKNNLVTDWDSDNEYTNDMTVKGQKVEITDFMSKHRIRGNIVESFDGVFLVKCDGFEQLRWIDNQCEGLLLERAGYNLK